MKLKQREFCHNCNQYVDFEFDDVTERQVIYCPVCGHEHYRELDSGTLLNIQFNQHQERFIRIAKMPDISFSMSMSDEMPLDNVIVNVEEREIISRTEDGRPIVKAKEGEESQKFVTDRRWGRDPRQ